MNNKDIDIKLYASEKQKIIDKALDEFLPEESKYPEVIHKAMRYSVLNGGKRIRPILSIAACEAVGGKTDQVVPAGCAIEMIHAFSLIHDDLPAMDNDDFRRGKPTNHKVFGEAIAILAGDALFARAFEILTSQTVHSSAEQVLDVTNRIAAASGLGGMVVGQIVDIISEGTSISADTLKFMHKNKTGALIEVSVSAGAILGGGSLEQISALSTYGWRIGQAFQITDDILDIEGDEKKLGKPIGSDIKNKKTTYPSLYGLSESKKMAKQTIAEAIDALSIFDEKADPLRGIAYYILNRNS
jgi:geranylgeranyl diphosphate synthase type II